MLKQQQEKQAYASAQARMETEKSPKAELAGRCLRVKMYVN
jgi:hypothetical protein